MSEFDARLERDAAALKRAQTLAANPSFVLDFFASALFLIVGLITLVSSGLTGWIVMACIGVGAAIVMLTPFGENIPVGAVVLLGIGLGTVAVITAALPGYITLGIVLLGAVLVLFTPNGGNFLLMGMAVLSLGAGIVTLWAAAMAIFGAGGEGH